MNGELPDITKTAMFAEAATEARGRVRGAIGANFPVQPEAKFWPLQRPRDPEGLLFINARGVRVLCAILELLEFHDVAAIESLVSREITRVPKNASDPTQAGLAKAVHHRRQGQDLADPGERPRRPARGAATVRHQSPTMKCSACRC